MSNDTIYALSTVAGKSALAVIRISGKQAGKLLSLCFSAGEYKSRQAYLRSFKHPHTQEVIDQILLFWFQAPHSFTGEDIVELHLHGSSAVIKDSLQALSEIEGFRLAEPGEFSRRAFDNQKMDLTEVEGIADLIEAETTVQRQHALKQAGGSLKKQYDHWRDSLIKIQAYIEAEIDFPDEDIPDGLSEIAKKNLLALQEELQNQLQDEKRGERLREGYRIALIGQPNTGKSSLLNQLVKREAAIVSSFAGTTRDVIEIYLDIAGYPVIISDTAGIRETDDFVEKEGVQRSYQKAEEADLILHILDATDKTPESLDAFTKKKWLIKNKADLIEEPTTPLPENQFMISAKTGSGVSSLISALEEHLKIFFNPTSETFVTRERHRLAVTEALDHIELCFNVYEKELIAEELRLAAAALGRVTGHIQVDDLLDVIFKDFCIGK